jgi:retron-type reverse transcriptase
VGSGTGHSVGPSFDNIDHRILLEILQRDIQDGRILQLIERFLKAGYMEDWQIPQDV